MRSMRKLRLRFLMAIDLGDVCGRGSADVLAHALRAQQTCSDRGALSLSRKLGRDG